jgi:uncharacterized LabA/DUF88 family protein
LHPKPLFNAYVDGFNLYKGALERFPNLKWLNLKTFCQSLRPDMQLNEVYYFTAQIAEKFPNDQAPRRQEKYLRVLRNQGIQVVRGKFRKDAKWLRLAQINRVGIIEPTLPAAFGLTQRAINSSCKNALPDLPKARVFDMEEKGSDVNLASYLLRDSYLQNISGALVITGDSDLVTPVCFAVRQGIDVLVVVPNKRQSADSLRRASTSLEHLNSLVLIDHQLPKVFFTPRGRQIIRPKEWE